MKSEYFSFIRTDIEDHQEHGEETKIPIVYFMPVPTTKTHLFIIWTSFLPDHTPFPSLHFSPPLCQELLPENLKQISKGS